MQLQEQNLPLIALDVWFERELNYSCSNDLLTPLLFHSFLSAGCLSFFWLTHLCLSQQQVLHCFPVSFPHGEYQVLCHLCAIYAHMMCTIELWRIDGVAGYNCILVVEGGICTHSVRSYEANIPAYTFWKRNSQWRNSNTRTTNCVTSSRTHSLSETFAFVRLALSGLAKKKCITWATLCFLWT